jgi:predicted dehydrogenase
MIGGEIEVALVGMGGYGIIYLRNLLREEQNKGMRLIATADTDPSRCELLGEVKKREIPVYPTLEALLAEKRPDLVVLSTPLQLHAEQVITCMEHGCHVLCEKPVASDPSQVQQMIAARDRAKKMVAIGYQWSFSDAIQNLKRDIISERFGKAKKLRTSVHWPRGEQYYKRNDWAGKVRDPQGRLVLDSPVNNGCAHFLHNMFFVLGGEMHQSDSPKSVTAELYRAHRIENYDTAVIRCTTRSGAELLFIASHATQLLQEPQLRYDFELATIEYGGETGTHVVANLLDGSVIDYGEPLESVSDAKLRDVCDAIRDNRPVACGLEAAAPQNTCMFAAQQSMPEITDFPKSMVVTEGEYGHRITYVRNLETVLSACYERFVMPTELRLDWAKPGRVQMIEGD